MIEAIAWAVRVELERIQAADEDGQRCWTPDLCGACAVGSAAVVRLLRRRGVEARLVFGSYEDHRMHWGDHCWVRVGHLLVDVTATQFSSTPVVLPRVLVVDAAGADEWCASGGARELFEDWCGSARRPWKHAIRSTYRSAHRRLVALVCRRAERALAAGVVPSPAEARVA